MGEYTKGDWGIARCSMADCQISFNDKDERGITIEWGGLFPLAEAEANAHLIAAAPDMYKALKGLCIAYGIDEHSIIVNQDPEYWERAVKALAKAEGKA